MTYKSWKIVIHEKIKFCFFALNLFYFVTHIEMINRAQTLKKLVQYRYITLYVKIFGKNFQKDIILISTVLLKKGLF